MVLTPDNLLLPNHIIRADYAHRRHIYGTGVGVAVLDTGIQPRADFLTAPGRSCPVNRILHFHDFVNGRPDPYDDAGHGSHICGKIASAAPVGAGEYLGIAPGASLIVLKALDQNGNAPVDTFLRALRWIRLQRRAYNIRIVNISIGTHPDVRQENSRLLVDAVDALWADGLIVCVAAGNNGPRPGSISAPGSSCAVITVGASDDDLPDRQPGSRRRYSGRGPAACRHVKPEIVAPGSRIVSCSSRPQGYTVKTGTSMSTALVSGALALLLEQEPYLSNTEAKNRLHDCARRLQLPHFQQGWGLLDISRLLA